MRNCGSLIELAKIRTRFKIKNIFKRKKLKGARIAVGRSVFLHRFQQYSDIPKRLIVSPGGVATSMLMHHCARFAEINCPEDTDDLKHIPNLPICVGDDRKVLFVYGDTDAIVNSLKRRKFINAHCRKLGSVLGVLAEGKFKYWLISNAINRQKHYFLNQTRIQSLSIHYDDLWDKIEEIADFFEITDERFVTEFPPRRMRNDVPKKSKPPRLVRFANYFGIPEGIMGKVNS